MDKYIERETAIKAVTSHYPDPGAMIAGIVCASTADVRPVVRGEWIVHNHLVGNELLDENEVLICSLCLSQRTKRKYNFCPNCGADMRGEAIHEGNETLRRL